MNEWILLPGCGDVLEPFRIQRREHPASPLTRALTKHRGCTGHRRTAREPSEALRQVPLASVRESEEDGERRIYVLDAQLTILEVFAERGERLLGAIQG